LVKYNELINNGKDQNKEDQNPKTDTLDLDVQTRKYNKIIFLTWHEGGSFTRSKTASKETTSNKIEPHFDATNVNMAKAINFIMSLD
jgi:hypothetical protein